MARITKTLSPIGRYCAERGMKICDTCAHKPTFMPEYQHFCGGNILWQRQILTGDCVRYTGTITPTVVREDKTLSMFDRWGQVVEHHAAGRK